MSQKYLVVERFRLVDQGTYLDAGMIFEPDENYARTSRSVAAALRTGWMKKVTDEEAAESEKMQAKAAPQPKKVSTAKTVDKPDKLPQMVDDFKPEQLADEVVGGDIVEARDARRRREEAANKPEVDEGDDEAGTAQAEATSGSAKSKPTTVKEEVKKKLGKIRKIRGKINT